VPEFCCVVTNPLAHRPAATSEQASAQLDGWFAASGAIVHDARVVVICIEHDVTELGSADRDFSRFSRLPVRNLLVA
jgi:hypothetical protein